MQPFSCQLGYIIISDSVVCCLYTSKDEVIGVKHMNKSLDLFYRLSHWSPAKASKGKVISLEKVAVCSATSFTNQQNKTIFSLPTISLLALSWQTETWPSLTLIPLSFSSYSPVFIVICSHPWHKVCHSRCWQILIY